MLCSPGKLISVYGAANLTGLAHPSAFSPSSTQSGFIVTSLWPHNSDIFTADQIISTYVIDRPERAVQKSAVEAY
jgi:hypothetical protein